MWSIAGVCILGVLVLVIMVNKDKFRRSPSIDFHSKSYNPPNSAPMIITAPAESQAEVPSYLAPFVTPIYSPPSTELVNLEEQVPPSEPAVRIFPTRISLLQFWTFPLIFLFIVHPPPYFHPIFSAPIPSTSSISLNTPTGWKRSPDLLSGSGSPGEDNPVLALVPPGFTRLIC